MEKERKFQIKETVVKVIFILLSSYIFLYLYSELSKFWTFIGGTSSKLIYFEYPIVVLLYTILYFPGKSKHKILNIYTFLPLIIIAGIYLIIDIGSNHFDRLLGISEYKNFPELFDTVPLIGIGILLYYILLIALLVWSIVKWCQNNSLTKIVIYLSLKIFILFIFIYIVSSTKFYEFQKRRLVLQEWDTIRKIRKNGRITTFIYYSHRAIEYKNRIKSLADTGENYNLYFDKLWWGSVKERCNIHIIVLESFIDVRLIENVTYSRDPLYPGMKKFLHKNAQFSLIISPVYGGGTPRAELEILTGLPALSLIESTEFNILRGYPVESFVNRLKQEGYLTKATIGTKSWYFNSSEAYKSIGFEEISFLNKNAYYKKDKNDDFIFDGDLLKANITMLKKYIKEKRTPIFNYVVGIYGHINFNRNYKKRPDVLKAYNVPDSINRIANQFYYRTRALSEYLENLKKIDPDCIIFITSDHLPTVLNMGVSYKYEKYINIGVLLNNWQVIDITGKKYYQLPWFIWDLLVKKKTPGKRDITTTRLQEMYLYILAQGMGIVKNSSSN